jgi:hypothetical protein
MHQFISLTSMRAWQAEAQSVLEMLQEQQAVGQHKSPRPEASSMPQVHFQQQESAQVDESGATDPAHPALAECTADGLVGLLRGFVDMGPTS